MAVHEFHILQRELATTVERVGIIPYTVLNNRNPYFLLGRDKDHGEWSDFGGGRREKESFWGTGVREFKEETSYSIHINETDVNVMLVVSKQNTAIIFLPLQLREIGQLNDLRDCVNRIISEDNRNLEVDLVGWHTFADIKRMISQKGKIYDKVADLLGPVFQDDRFAYVFGQYWREQSLTLRKLHDTGKFAASKFFKSNPCAPYSGRLPRENLLLSCR